MSTRPRTLLGSGWIPAVLVYALAVLLLRNIGLVGARDSLAFTVWFAWAHTIPGVVLWRALDWRTRSAHGRPFPEDVALGSILGIVVGIAAYLLAVLAGLPLLVAGWPLLVLVPAMLTSSGRALLLRRQREPTPAWWSWSLALVMLYAVLFSAVRIWHGLALTPESITAPYIDEPFHLSLIGELRHHFPATVPYVEGTPLRYHWLVYPFLASGTWGTGIEPRVLLRLLAPAALSALMLFGLAAAASRVSGRRWAGVAAAAIACLVSPLDVMGWTPAHEPWIGPSWVSYLSPTQVLANALAPLLVVLIVGVARGAAHRPRHWILTALVMLAVAGAKSAMLPLFVAGLCGTTVVLLVVRRRVPWRVGGLALLSVGVFALATAVFYGPGSRSLTFGPFQIVDAQAMALGLIAPGGTPPEFVRLTLSAVFVICVAGQAVGALGLFARGGWRRPVPWLLLGSWTAAVGVLLLMRHPGHGQYYFYFSAVVPMAVLSAAGWARAAGPLTRRTVGVVAAACLTGLASATAIAAATSSRRPLTSASTDAGRMLASFWYPLALALAVVLLLTLVFHLVTRRSDKFGGRTLLVAISLVIGYGLPYPLANALRFHDGPIPAKQLGDTTIREGGLAAATWLRGHSDPDDLIATNSHTRLLGRAAAFDHRSFWISAYSERRVLVEGWAYIAPEVVGLPSNELTNRSSGPPFWDPERLRLNDEVFTHPTAANLAQLQRRYGVDWLFVDTGRAPALARLERLADRRFSTRNYVVFALRA